MRRAPGEPAVVPEDRDLVVVVDQRARQRGEAQERGHRGADQHQLDADRPPARRDQSHGHDHRGAQPAEAEQPERADPVPEHVPHRRQGQGA